MEISNTEKEAAKREAVTDDGHLGSMCKILWSDRVMAGSIRVTLHIVKPLQNDSRETFPIGSSGCLQELKELCGSFSYSLFQAAATSVVHLAF